jgi:hypothetical protein
MPNARRDRSERSRRKLVAAERGVRSGHAPVSELRRTPSRGAVTEEIEANRSPAL